jgi:hypothetical protein
MKESKAMVKKEIGFMKKKGAPKSMIKHEMKEAGMKKMASGGLAAGHKSADGIAKKGKTKGKEVKMAFGGVAKGVAASMQGAAKKAVASKTAPKQMQFMSDALRGGAMKPPIGGGSLTQRAMQVGAQRGMGEKANMSSVNPALAKAYADSQRMKQGTPSTPDAGAARAFSDMQKQKANALRGLSMKPSTGGMMGAGQRGLGGMPSKPKALAGLGAAVAGKMMGRKAGGLAAGHKEADGIAKKGKTKAMQVKMAGGGKTKKYC